MSNNLSNPINQHIARDAVINTMSNFGRIRNISGFEIKDSIDQKEDALLIEGFDKAFLYWIKTLGNITLEEFNQRYYEKLKVYIPTLTQQQGFDSLSEYANRIIEQYHEMVVKLNEIKSETRFLTYLTQQGFASLLSFETITHKKPDNKIIATTRTFIEQQFKITIDHRLQKMLDTMNIAGIDIPFELLNLEGENNNMCAMYLYTIMFNLVPYCDGKHPVLDDEESTRLYYFDDIDSNNMFEGFHLTQRGIKLFEQLYNLSRLHITQDEKRDPYEFGSPEEIYELMRGTLHHKSDSYDAANMVSVARSIFHLIGHHPDEIDIDHILDTPYTEGVNSVIDMSKLHDRRSKQRWNQEVSILDIQWLNQDGREDSYADWKEFSSHNTDPITGVWYHPNIMIAGVKASIIGRPKSASSHLTKLVNNPKYNHVDQMHDKIGNRIEIEDTGNQNTNRFSQLKVLHQISTDLGGQLKKSLIKGDGFIAFAQSLVDEKSDFSKEMNQIHGMKEFLDGLLGDSSKLMKNSKSSKSYEDCKVITNNGTEYQVVSPGIYDQGYNNHSFYNVAKMVEVDMRAFGFVDMKRYQRNNTRLLDEELQTELAVRRIRSKQTYDQDIGMQTQWLQLALQIAQQEYETINEKDRKGLTIESSPMLYYIITQLGGDWKDYSMMGLSEVFDQATISANPIINKIRSIISSPDGFDELYQGLCHNPLKQEGDSKPLKAIQQYVSDQLLNIQSAQLDGTIADGYFVKQGRRARLQKIFINTYGYYGGNNLQNPIIASDNPLK